MAKRFTDTEIFNKAWYRKLNPTMKCAWEFLTKRCDFAGVWSVDTELMSFQIGDEVTMPQLLAAFGEHVVEIEGDKLFLPGFVEFQYGELSEDCKPHKAVIDRLKKLGLFERVSKGYPKGIQTLQDKDKDKDKDQEKEKERKTKFDFEVLYAQYPRKVGKKKGIEICKRVIKTPDDFAKLKEAISRYREHCEKAETETEFIKHFSTFMGSWEDWTDPQTGTGPDRAGKTVDFVEYMRQRGYNDDGTRISEPNESAG